eukprot:XP_019918474.1 PREDICTED: uncharacterized protein LOC105317634 [Crassostrea gigas]
MCQEPTSRIRVSLIEAYLLMIVLGIFGAHHFYLKRPRWGLLYLFTFGLLGAGWLIDIFRLPVLVARFNNEASHPDPSLAKKKRLDDIYVLWFPGGLIGLHHFYLNNTRLGIFYLCTFGIFGIGWLIDAFLMPYHVKIANSDSQDSTEKRFTTTCILAISPTGLLGAHHYYLNQFGFGLLYTFTFGIFGVGYIVDWFRFPVLLKRSNKGRTMLHSTHKHLDDAYLLWFPLGFLGFHHFYLDRRGWGLLYMYTFGFLGIGWLVDLCRMRTLVENCNRDIDERMHLTGNNIVGGHVPLNYGQTGPSPPGYSNPHPGIYQTQQNGYGSVPGMNDQPPPYEAASVPTKVKWSSARIFSQVHL